MSIEVKNQLERNDKFETPRGQRLDVRLRQPTLPRLQTPVREASTGQMISHGIALALHPYLTKDIIEFESVLDIDIDFIRHGVSGLIFAMDGTLCPQGSLDISPEMEEKLKEIKAKMRVCIHDPHANQVNAFQQLGIPVVAHAAAKPDPSGYIRGAYHYLDRKPEQCAVVTSDLFLDSGAVNAGMRIIQVPHIPGEERLQTRLTREYANMVKSIYNSPPSKNDRR